MRIGFVAEPYETKEASGMGYLILAYMEELASREQEVELVVYSSIPIDRTRVIGTFENILIPSSYLGKLWWFATKKLEVSFLLFSSPMLPLIVRKPTQAVPIMLEVVTNQFPNRKSFAKFISHYLFSFFRDRILVPLSVKKASHLITATEYVQKEIARAYQMPEKRIIVAPVGYQDLSSYLPQPSLVPYRYFFFTGKVKPRKNVHGLVKAFILFKEKTGSDAHLVISGSTGKWYRSYMEELLDAHRLKNFVHFVGFVSISELAAYYAHAIAYVFPSLQEGFGMPLIESMKIGTPVITSNISVMPEVTGGAALLVDPYAPESIANALETLEKNIAVRTDLINKGRIRAEIFSWKNSIDAILIGLRN